MQDMRNNPPQKKKHIIFACITQKPLKGDPGHIQEEQPLSKFPSSLS